MKHHHIPLVKVGSHGGQVINGVLAKASLTVCPLGLLTHLVVIFTIPEYVVGIDILGIWSNPSIESLAIVEKAK